MSIQPPPFRPPFIAPPQIRQDRPVVSIATKPPLRVNRKEAKSFTEFIIYFFDPTFSRYVTPWIIRITWCILLTTTSISLLYTTVVTINEAIPEKPQPPRPNLNRQINLEIQRELFNRDQPINRLLNNPLFRYLVYVTSAVLATLWLRVVLELCIIPFDISNTLKTIKDTSH